jgi:erythromycin esterase-like protein
LLDRLTVRAEAEAAGSSQRPAEYYELRDEWMARAVAALADSIDRRRKVVVWLHNDHARYANLDAGRFKNRSVGSFPLNGFLTFNP